MVPAKALTHVDHAALAVAKAAFQLLALLGQGGDERRGEAFEGLVVVDQDAVRGLQAGGEGGAEFFAGGRHCGFAVG